MSFLDNVKGLVGKGKQLASEHSEQVGGAVDKAGDFIDSKSGGKYADKVDKIQDAAKNSISDNSSPENASAGNSSPGNSSPENAGPENPSTDK